MDKSRSSPIDIPTDWDWAPLGELVDISRGISYGIVQPGKHDPKGVPVVRVNNLKDGYINTADAIRVAEDVEAQYERTRLRGGEVLLTLVGTLGECAVVPFELRGWNVARAVAVIPPDTRTDPHWISYCLRSAELQNLMRAWATTTVQATLNLRDVRRLPILLAPERIRVSIVDTVSLLDDKIEQNRRTAQTLEKVAQAIFRAWFVDFEPVKAKAAGATSFPSVPQQVFDSLPTTFSDSPIGLIPEGWEVRPLSDIARLTMGQSPKSEFYNYDGIGIPFHQGVTNFGFRFPSHRVYCTAEGRMAESGDVLVSVRAPVGRINVADRELMLGRGLAGLKHHGSHQSYLLCQLRHVFADEDSVGEGTIYRAVTKRFLAEMPLLVSPADIEQAFESVIRPLDDLVKAAETETRVLMETRDYLLLKLLSGEVRVVLDDERAEDAV